MRPRLRQPDRVHLALIVVLAALAGCEEAPPDGTPAPATWVWDLPEGIPAPFVPADNPMSPAKVDLGRRLFFDPALSGNGTMGCVACHLPEAAFTDGLALSPGATGELTGRNSPPLQNSAYYGSLTWMNPALLFMEQQILVPMFAEFPVEMGITGHEEAVLGRLSDDPQLPDAFRAAFPDDDAPLTLARARDALAAYMRSLTSFDSPYDRFLQGREDHGMSDASLRGMDLFFSDTTQCSACHGGFHLSTSIKHSALTDAVQVFENNGQYNLDGEGSYPSTNRGLAEITGDPADMGRFRPPSLRNVALTPPYFHDGSVAELEDVVRIYARGGRLTPDGPLAGDGATSPLKSPHVAGFDTEEGDITDLVAFLRDLTDPTWLTQSGALNNTAP